MVNCLSSLRYWFKRSMVFMRRFPHSQGFGIQSPSAYRFDREVINAHRPYDAYADLKHAFPHEDRLTMKLARLYFRIANATQARRWALCAHRNDVYRAYIEAGCRTAIFVDGDEESEVDKIAASDVLLMAMEDDRWPMYEAFVSSAHEHSILIVEGIYASKKAKMRWKELVNDERTRVAFDLYDCGIVFFDHTKSKQLYIINF